MKEKDMTFNIGPTTARILWVVALVLFSLFVSFIGGSVTSDFLQVWCVIAIILSWVGAIALFIVTLVFHFDS